MLVMMTVTANRGKIGGGEGWDGGVFRFDMNLFGGDCKINLFLVLGGRLGVELGYLG